MLCKWCGKPLTPTQRKCPACVNGAERALTCQVDIFALGVLFHQYFTGALPLFSREKYSCPGVAVLDGAQLGLDSSLPEDVAQLLASMLQGNPEDRPTAWQVFCAFQPKASSIAEPPPLPKAAPSSFASTPGPAPTLGDPSSYFKKGGNL